MEQTERLYLATTEEKDGKVLFALQELDYFLPLVGVAKTESKQDATAVLSLGFTNEAKEQGFTESDVEDLKDDGFTIKTVGNTYYVLAKTEYGILYGVYAFLEQLCGVKVYGVDEIKTGKANFKPLNITENPTFDFRERPWLFWSKYNKTFHTRLRLHEPYWLTPYHSTFVVLPPKEYRFEHPDWYAGSGQQICFTNDDAFEEYAKNSLAIVDKFKSAKARTALMMVGQEDTNGYCECAKCKEHYEKYGGVSGVIMRFVNKLAKRINEYVEENMPEKTVKCVAFSYGKTAIPPVDENLNPVHESVCAEKGVGIFYAPLGANWSKPLCDEEWNKDTARSFEAYKKLGYEAYLWPYDSVFDDELLFFSEYHNVKTDFLAFRDMRSILVLDMGHKSHFIAFDEMSNYVRSQLMWNVDLSVEALVAEFMENYYKESMPQVKQYFEEYRARQERYNFGDDTLYSERCPALKDDEHLDKDELIRWIDLLTEGEKNAKSKLVALRVARERLTPIYLLLECFALQLSREELDGYVSLFEKDCEESGILYATEVAAYYMTDLETKIVKWRGLLA